MMLNRSSIKIPFTPPTPDSPYGARHAVFSAARSTAENTLTIKTHMISTETEDVLLSWARSTIGKMMSKQLPIKDYRVAPSRRHDGTQGFIVYFILRLDNIK